MRATAALVALLAVGPASAEPPAFTPAAPWVLEVSVAFEGAYVPPPSIGAVCAAGLVWCYVDSIRISYDLDWNRKPDEVLARGIGLVPLTCSAAAASEAYSVCVVDVWTTPREPDEPPPDEGTAMDWNNPAHIGQALMAAFGVLVAFHGFSRGSVS